MIANVFVVGVAVVDIVMNLDEMPRLPEKYRARGAAIVGGGCGGNAAVAVNRLGGKARLAARLGDDPIAEMIIGQLRAEGVDCEMARKFTGARSSFSSIFIDAAGERQIVNYRDETLPGEADWLLADAPDFDAALADNRWSEGARAVMQMARRSGKPGVLDAEAPVLDSEAAMRAASHVVFSAQGLREFAGNDDLRAGLKQAENQLGDFVGVTDGPQGIWWRVNAIEDHMPSFAVPVVDTLGAGDVWHGAFALALGEQLAIPEAVRFSNAAAALKCTKSGGRDGIPTRDKIETFLRSDPPCN